MTRRQIRECVLRCRKTTTMANAFRRAFGIKPIYEKPQLPAVVSVDVFKDMAECFANASSIMDRLYDSTQS